MTRSLCKVCGRPTDAFLCQHCLDELRAVFDDLPELAEAVADLASRQSRVYRSTRRLRVPDQDWRGNPLALRSSPWPVDLDAAAMLTDAGDTLTVCANHLHDHGRPPSTRTGALTVDTSPRMLADLVRFMLAHVDAIRYVEAADQIHHRIHALRDRMRRIVDHAPSPFYAGPCHATVTEPVVEDRDGTLYTRVVTHRCERDLYAWPDRGIRCDGYRSRTPGDRGCGTEHSVRDREQFLIDSIEDALVPLDVLADVTKGRRPLLRMVWPPPATVRSWRFRGRLIVRNLDRQGRELFRGGDVLDLVREWNVRAPIGRRSVG